MVIKSSEIKQKAVLLMNADPEESAGIALLLRQVNLTAQFVVNPFELKTTMQGASFLAVIMDLDSVPLDNRSIRDLASQFPAIPLLCISKERFHPELKDSIRDHIYACLTKPIDSDELNYWLKSIQEDKG